MRNVTFYFHDKEEIPTLCILYLHLHQSKQCLHKHIPILGCGRSELGHSVVVLHFQCKVELTKKTTL